MKTTLEIRNIEIQRHTNESERTPANNRPAKPQWKTRVKMEIGILDTHIVYTRTPRYFDVECGQSFSIVNI